MKTVTFALLCLASAPAFAYDASYCAGYVKQNRLPAAYCLTVQASGERGDETAWTDALRAVPGPIRALEKKMLKEQGCESGNGCCILNLTERDGIAITSGTDGEGSGGTIRYFASFDHNNHTQRVVYTIDVRQDYDQNTDTFVRRVTKVQKFQP